jgi:hypothetical protein
MAIGFPVKADYATGDVLSAANMNDLSGSVNLLESAQYAAGKNKIINGDFNINQRAFSSTTSSGVFMYDRYQSRADTGTSTFTAQTFTPGTAPVAGYESTNFLRIDSTGQTATNARTAFFQLIENVRTFAGETVTFSFWAKASSGTPSIAAFMNQNFGSGGSTTVNINGQKTAITTSWARYSFTFSVPSISGKTIGAGSYLGAWIFTSAGSDYNTQTNSLGIQTTTIDVWGVQVEEGSVASAFQTATGTIQGELAACQRYYFRTTATAQYQPFGGFALSESTSQCLTMFTFPVTMRVRPTTLDSASVRFYDVVSATAYSGGTLTLADSTPNIGMTRYTHTSSPFTLGRMMITNTDSATGFYGFSAEL